MYRALPESGSKFEQTTIGNLGASTVTTAKLFNLSVDKSDVGIVFGIFDLLSVIIFLLFLRTVKIQQNKIVKEADDSVISAADYTVRVSDLPRDTFNREELQYFFQTNFGDVADVAMLSFTQIYHCVFYLMFFFNDLICKKKTLQKKYFFICDETTTT